ncbi:MAG: SAVED domain-containing protein [Chloroflexi bacterium]|nr:SAVED domain-containing protein [Chloroflexota bacterium]
MLTFVEAVKFFENIKPGIEGAAAVGSVLASTAKVTVLVIQKGAKLISYLIKPSKKERGARSKSTKGTKGDVAILVEISRVLRKDVALFLDTQKIEADMIVITNIDHAKSSTEFLSPDDPNAWVSLVQEFTAAINTVKAEVGGARYHIFLSAPLPIAFGLGAVWGTVDEAVIYHWENNTYWPALPISRALRMSNKRS